MRTIFNLTQHVATADQKAQASMVEPAEKEAVKSLLTVEEGDADPSSLRLRAQALTQFVTDNAPEGAEILVGGYLNLMRPLVNALEAAGFACVFSHSGRVSVDQPQADGSVKKVSEFRHVKFVSAA